ncbi:MAG: hypothetical protein KKE30_14725 [Gammaproteobacteria bacterium]|nr:hypothetical protein [Gammaproteobacteria bacterium]MBU1557243.1 hypothetical protein [Gammaproteobacteria bacterium]MBU2071647.1 hypothetical protein [Gammaproteobacteria bacterium]MBU2182853.1 hypothetical protein [Gammaproteobacteria bacterium]MBU2204003.1 hypothetical protein [Gammaproteobacteria bacterium]
MCNRLFVAVLCLTISGAASAKPGFEKKLIVSCTEAVSLFASSEKSSRADMKLTLNQAFSTSNTEALQMGYCKGVIDAIMQLEPYCRYDNWYPVAERLVREGAGRKNVIEYIKNEC